MRGDSRCLVITRKLCHFPVNSCKHLSLRLSLSSCALISCCEIIGSHAHIFPLHFAQPCCDWFTRSDSKRVKSKQTIKHTCPEGPKALQQAITATQLLSRGFGKHAVRKRVGRSEFIKDRVNADSSHADENVNLFANTGGYQRRRLFIWGLQCRIFSGD